MAYCHASDDQLLEYAQLKQKQERLLIGKQCEAALQLDLKASNYLNSQIRYLQREHVL